MLPSFQFSRLTAIYTSLVLATSDVHQISNVAMPEMNMQISMYISAIAGNMC